MPEANHKLIRDILPSITHMCDMCQEKCRFGFSKSSINSKLSILFSSRGDKTIENDFVCVRLNGFV